MKQPLILVIKNWMMLLMKQMKMDREKLNLKVFEMKLNNYFILFLEFWELMAGGEYD